MPGVQHAHVLLDLCGWSDDEWTLEILKSKYKPIFSTRVFPLEVAANMADKQGEKKFLRGAHLSRHFLWKAPRMSGSTQLLLGS